MTDQLPAAVPGNNETLAESKAISTQPVNPLAKVFEDPEKLNKLDVDKLERLLDMQREITAKQEQQAFTQALLAFQAACPPIEKIKPVHNKHGKHMYDFAPLDYIIRVAGPHLRSNGFGWNFDTTPQDDGSVVIACTLMHTGGHSKTCEVRIAPLSTNQLVNAAQANVQQVSYGRRNAFTGVTGLVPTDEDTDAIPTVDADATISDEQVGQLRDLVHQLEVDASQLFFDKCQISDLNDLPAAKFSIAKNWLNAKLAQQRQSQPLDADAQAWVDSMEDGQ